MVPSYKKVSMRFIRDFLAGRKQLLKASEARTVNVPAFPEFAVAKVFKHFSDKEEIVQFMDYYEDIGDMPERWYFYNVLGTLKPELLDHLIK